MLRYLLLLASLMIAPHAWASGAAFVEVEQTVERMGRMAGAAHACGDDVYLRIGDCAGALLGKEAKRHRRLFLDNLDAGFYAQPIDPARCAQVGFAIRNQPFWVLCPGQRP